MLSMTKESEALLNALVPAVGATTTDHTEAIYAALEPLHVILDTVEIHITEIDRFRRAADRAETDARVWGWFERFKQSIDAARRLNGDAKRSLEALSDLAFQMDDYACQMRETLARQDEVPMVQVVRVPVAEHAHMQATIKEANAQLANALTELNQLRDAQSK